MNEKQRMFVVLSFAVTALFLHCYFFEWLREIRVDHFPRPLIQLGYYRELIPAPKIPPPPPGFVLDVDDNVPPPPPGFVPLPRDRSGTPPPPGFTPLNRETPSRPPAYRSRYLFAIVPRAASSKHTVRWGVIAPVGLLFVAGYLFLGRNGKARPTRESDHS